MMSVKKKLLLIPIIILAGCSFAGPDYTGLEWAPESRILAREWCRKEGGDSIVFRETTARTGGRVISYAVCMRGFSVLALKEVNLFEGRESL